MKHPLLLAALCCTLSIHAQVQLVKDIYPGPNPRNADPQFLTPFGTKLYFNATDSGTGRELYSYDGTNVTLVKDLNPGIHDGCYNAGDYFDHYAVVGTKMYFSGNDSTHGDELFEYDGLSSPLLAADINPGTGSSVINNYMTYGGKLYFMAYDPTYHYQFYVFDPGTGMAIRKTSLANGVYTGQGTTSTVFRGKIYFAGNDGFTGNELYAYDPIAGSASMFADIRKGSGSSDPNNMIIGNDTLYFTASDPTHGPQIFKYTGVDTPLRITSIGNGVQSLGGHLIYFKNMLVFSGDNSDGKGSELYKYDIATGTTSLVYDINPGSNSSVPGGFVVYRTKLYFAAGDGTHGRELWVWDGTSNPYMLADIDSGGAASNSSPGALTVWNGVLYMNATNTTAGTELFKYEDTTTGIVNILSGMDVKVYPVPTSGITNIQIDARNDMHLSLTVFDMNGRLIYSVNEKDYVPGPNTIPVNMHNWPSGSYYYRLTDHSGKVQSAGRLLKE